MLNAINIFLSIVFLFCFNSFCLISAEEARGLPAETAVVEFPQEQQKTWRPILQTINSNYGRLEVIPSDQNIENWKDLIAIHYYDRDPKTEMNSLIRNLKKSYMVNLPKCCSSWKILEKDRDSFIYEWIVNQDNKHFQHEITRIWLGEGSIHRVGYTRRSEKFNDQEKEDWVSILKERASIGPLCQVSGDGLTLASYLKHPLLKMKDFSKWRLVNRFCHDNHHELIRLAPPNQLELNYLNESLEIMAITLSDPFTIDEVFEREKEYLKKTVKNIGEIQVLQQSDSEVIYQFSYPQGFQVVTKIHRAVLDGQKSYSLGYKKCSISEMRRDQINQWVDRLCAIPIKEL